MTLHSKDVAFCSPQNYPPRVNIMVLKCGNPSNVSSLDKMVVFDCPLLEINPTKTTKVMNVKVSTRSPLINGPHTSPWDILTTL